MLDFLKIIRIQFIILFSQFLKCSTYSADRFFYGLFRKYLWKKFTSIFKNSDIQRWSYFDELARTRLEVTHEENSLGPRGNPCILGNDKIQNLFRLNLCTLAVDQGCHTLRWIALPLLRALCNSNRVETNKSIAKFSGENSSLSLVFFKRYDSLENKIWYHLSVFSDNQYNFPPTITILLNTSAIVHRLNLR